jgi:hypothetical protein
MGQANLTLTLVCFMPCSLLHNKLTTAAWKKLLAIRGNINKARHEQQQVMIGTHSFLLC